MARNIQVLCSKTCGGYSASLYEQLIDVNGSILYLDLLKRAYMYPYFHHYTEEKDKTIFKTENQHLYQSLAEFILDDLQEYNYNLYISIKLADYKANELFKIIFFFFCNPWFESIEFFYLQNCLDHLLNTDRRRVNRYKKFDDYLQYVSYGHNQKSIKRTLYKNFEKSLQTIDNYSTKADMIICRSFDDVNLISRLLSLPIKHSLFEDTSLTNAILFLRWLQKHHKPSLIVASICSTADYSGSFHTPVWVDIMRMVEQISITHPYAFKKHFTKIRMNANSLHDELVRINSIVKIQQSNNITYEYSDAEYSLEVEIADMRLSLVKDTLSLHEWGKILHNCLFGYKEKILKKQCLIVGVFRNDVLTYALELNGKSILQAHGKYNSEIPSKDFELIQKAFI